MGLFGFGSKKKYAVITEADQSWVEDRFELFMNGFGYGYPRSADKPVLFDKECFPLTHQRGKITIENLVEDLCMLMYLDRRKIALVTENDIRDLDKVPYSFDDQPFNAELAKTNAGYELAIAQKLYERPEEAISFLTRELTKMVLMEHEVPYTTGGDEDVIVYLAAVFFGHGPLLLHAQSSAYRIPSGQWERGGYFVADIPLEVMMYSLAFHIHLTGEDPDKLTELLKDEPRKIFDRATSYLNDYPSPLRDEKNIYINKLWVLIIEQRKALSFESCVSIGKKILENTENPDIKTDTHNGVGYDYLRLEQFEEAILYFQKALEMWPDYFYPLNNLGYAFIRLGKLEEGDDEVDLLEYHYAEYLLETNQKDLAVEYLQKAVEKKESEAIRKMEELGLS